MSFPPSLPTRAVSIGSAASLPVGVPLTLEAETRAVRPDPDNPDVLVDAALIWAPSKSRLEPLPSIQRTATPGGELVWYAPVTDVAGYRDAATGQEIVLAPGEHSHLYKTKLRVLAGTQILREYDYPAYPVPTGADALDLDVDLVFDAATGVAVTIPAAWEDIIAAAQAFAELKGLPNGVAELGPDGVVPDEQVRDQVGPQKGQAGGLATLDNAGVVPIAQIPVADIASSTELLTTVASSAELNTAFLQVAADAEDDVTPVSRRLELTDTATARGGLLYIEHYGDGSNSDVPGQAYGIDVHNWPGAAQGVVVHQYSDNGPAVQIDNTDSDTALRIKNAINTTNNPGNPAGGTGPYIECRSTDNVTRFAVRDSGAVALSVKSTEATYPAVYVINPSTQYGLRITQSGAQVAVRIEAESGAAGYYPLDVSGQNYGPRFTTATDGQKTLTVQKNGTGSGDALYIVNKGTGASILINDGSANTWLVDKTGVINWNAAALSASAATGGTASALPATPAGYINAKVGGVAAKIPYYNA